MTPTSATHSMRPMPTENRIIACLLIGAAALGLCHGIKLANWQVALEGAQVLAGLVEYPASNPQGIYHQKLWTLLNQVPALVLYLGAPERLLSVIISGLGGAAFYLGVSLVTFAVCRNLLVSLAMPLVVLWTGAAGAAGGITYPVLLLNSPHTYGSFGLSVAVVVLGLVGCGHFRTAAFIVGLAPAVHPSWGVWINLVLCLSLLLNIRCFKPIIGKIVPWLLAGYAVTGVSLLLWFFQSSNIDVQPSEHIAEYVSVFVEKWDYHRQPVGISDLSLKNSWNITTALLASFICAVWMFTRSNGQYGHRQILFTGLLVSGILAAFFSGIMLFATDKVPSFFLALMPQRWFNISIICFLPLLFGTLEWRQQKSIFWTLVFLIVGIIVFKFIELFPGYIIGFAVCLLIFSGLLGVYEKPSKKNTLSRWMLGFLVFFVPAVSVSPIFFLVERSMSVFFWTNSFFVLSTAAIALVYGYVTGVDQRARQWMLVSAVISIGGGLILLAFWLLALSDLQGTTGEAISASMALFSFGAVLIVFRVVIAKRGVRIVWRIDQSVKKIPEHLSFLRHRRMLMVRANSETMIVIGMVIFICLFLGSKILSDASWASPRFSDRTNSRFWETVAEGDGFLLTGPGLYMIQVRTRRPVLIDGGALDWLPYVPEAGPAVAEILAEVYGVDFFNPPNRSTGKLGNNWGKTLWTQRTLGEWAILKEKYDVTNILVKNNWVLNLPMLMQDQGYTLYDIP